MADAIKLEICRLCLKDVSKNYYEMVEEKLVMVNAIFMDLNWTVSENPIMCCECSEKLQSSYDFKSTCLTTEEDIKTAINGKQSGVDLWQIGNENNQSSVEQKEVCRFCLKSNMCFNVEEKDDVLLMLHKCVPELDLSTVRDRVICQSCLAALEGMFNFVTSCSVVEETINNYHDSECLNGSDKVDLYKVLRFTETKKESDGDEILVEEFMDDDEVQKTLVKSEDVEDGELHLKSEISVKDEPLEFEEESEHSFKNEDIEVKKETQSKRFEENLATIKPVVTTGLNGNQMSSIEELQEPHAKHTLMKINDMNISYQCKCCPFQTRCEYKPIRHAHTNRAEVKMHKCDSCSYQTKLISRLKRHLLVHKDSSEVTMYKCDLCTYQTKHKDNVKTHLLSHKDTSEITMYTCAICSYQTKYKTCLRAHILKQRQRQDCTNVTHAHIKQNKFHT